MKIIVRIPRFIPSSLRTNNSQMIKVNQFTKSGISQPAINSNDNTFPFSINGTHCCITHRRKSKFSMNETLRRNRN